jgi:hypothetical protein
MSSHGHRELAGITQCLAILPLVGKNHTHIVDGVESGRVVLSECLLSAIDGSLVLHKCLAILPLVGKIYAHVVDGVESERVVFSKCLLSAIEGSLEPLKCLVIPPLVVETQALLSRVEG